MSSVLPAAAELVVKGGGIAGASAVCHLVKAVDRTCCCWSGAGSPAARPDFRPPGRGGCDPAKTLSVRSRIPSGSTRLESVSGQANFQRRDFDSVVETRIECSRFLKTVCQAKSPLHQPAGVVRCGQLCRSPARPIIERYEARLSAGFRSPLELNHFAFPAFSRTSIASANCEVALFLLPSASSRFPLAT